MADVPKITLHGPSGRADITVMTEVAPASSTPPSTTPAPTAPSGWPIMSRRVLLIVVGVLAAVGAAGGLAVFGAANLRDARRSILPTEPTTVTVTGSLRLYGSDCVHPGAGGYSDIDMGAGVVLTNQDKKIIGVSVLDRGSPGHTWSCYFPFTIRNVPANEEYYAVEVTHRGAIVHSRADMILNGWSFDLVLGDDT